MSSMFREVVFEREWKAQNAAARRTHPSLVRRLKHSSTLGVEDSHHAAVSALCWSPDGALLLGGSEDAVLKIWDLQRSSQQPSHSFDTGHTSSIYGLRFLPDTNNSKIVTCSADRQVRVIDLARLAVKPYVSHRSRVKTLATVSNVCIISGGEDGTVRRWDVREPGPGPSPEQQNRSLLVEQRSERVGRAGVRVAVNSIAVDPMRPHIFATGGSDPLVRVFDMRMLQPAEAPVDRVAWLYCCIPEHMKDSLRVPPIWHAPMQRMRHLTGIAFTDSGQEIVGSYSSEKIYTFRTRADARSYDSIFSDTSTRGPAGRSGHQSQAQAQTRWMDMTPPLRTMRRPAAAAAAAAAAAPRPGWRAAPPAGLGSGLGGSNERHGRLVPTRAAPSGAEATGPPADRDGSGLRSLAHVPPAAAAGGLGARVTRGSAAAAGAGEERQPRRLRPRLAREAPPPSLRRLRGAAQAVGPQAAGGLALFMPGPGPGPGAGPSTADRSEEPMLARWDFPFGSIEPPPVAGVERLGQQAAGQDLQLGGEQQGALQGLAAAEDGGGQASAVPQGLASAGAAAAAGYTAGGFGSGGSGAEGLGASGSSHAAGPGAGPDAAAGGRGAIDSGAAQPSMNTGVQGGSLGPRRTDGLVSGPTGGRGGAGRSSRSAPVREGSRMSVSGTEDEDEEAGGSKRPAAEEAGAGASKRLCVDAGGRAEGMGGSGGMLASRTAGGGAGASALTPFRWASRLLTPWSWGSGADTRQQQQQQRPPPPPPPPLADVLMADAGSREEPAGPTAQPGPGLPAAPPRPAADAPAVHLTREPGGEVAVGASVCQSVGAAGGVQGVAGATEQPGAQHQAVPAAASAAAAMQSDAMDTSTAGESLGVRREGGGAGRLPASPLPGAQENGPQVGSSVPCAPIDTARHVRPEDGGGAGTGDRPSRAGDRPSSTGDRPSSTPPQAPTQLVEQERPSPVPAQAAQPTAAAAAPASQPAAAGAAAAGQVPRPRPAPTRSAAPPMSIPARPAPSRMRPDAFHGLNAAAVRSQEDTARRAQESWTRSLLELRAGLAPGLGAAAAMGAGRPGPGVGSQESWTRSLLELRAGLGAGVPGSDGAGAQGAAAASAVAAAAAGRGLRGSRADEQAGDRRTPQEGAGAGTPARTLLGGLLSNLMTMVQQRLTGAEGGGASPQAAAAAAGPQRRGGEAARGEQRQPEQGVQNGLPFSWVPVGGMTGLGLGLGGGGADAGAFAAQLAAGMGAGMPSLQDLQAHARQWAVQTRERAAAAREEDEEEGLAFGRQRRRQARLTAAERWELPGAEGDGSGQLGAGGLWRQEAGEAQAAAPRGRRAPQLRRFLLRAGHRRRPRGGPGGRDPDASDGSSSGSGGYGGSDGWSDASGADDMDVLSIEDGDELQLPLGYTMCYEGHRNASGTKNLCLMGQRSRYVVSSSDDGHLFVWDLHTGELLNMVAGAAGDNTVQVHPFDPVIASCGTEPTVRLWSPEAESAARARSAQRSILRTNIVEQRQAQRLSRNLMGLMQGGVDTRFPALGAAAPAVRPVEAEAGDADEGGDSDEEMRIQLTPAAGGRGTPGGEEHGAQIPCRLM